MFVKGWNEEQMEDFEIGSSPKQTNFHINCIVFALIHPLFIVIRIPIFIMYALLTCCCDKGNDLDANFGYEWLILSFDYIEKNEAEFEANPEYVPRNPCHEWR